MPDTLRVRKATDADRAAIADIHHRAFAASRFSYHGEAELVDDLVAEGDLALSIVAEVDGRIAGSCILSRMKATADGASLSAWAVGPIGVLPDAQQQGIGSALMNTAIAHAGAQGVQAVFLLGSPAYYARFGFSAAAAAPFANSFAGVSFQARILDVSMPPARSGSADYAPAFMRDR